MITVTKTSSFAKIILSGNPVLRVHSVYQNTVNLITGTGNILALQSHGSPLSPISLIVDGSINNGLVPCGIRLREGDVLNPGTLDLTSASVYDPGLNPCPPERFFTLRSNIQKTLLSESHNIFASIVLDMSYQGDNELIYIGAKSIIEDNRLIDLIGLGIGLTPGGDDFLCGVLAGLILSGEGNSERYFRLCSQISGNLHRTNDISGAFLRCATLELFSEAVTSLTSAPESSYIHDLFSAIGHSSGMDTLSGIYYSL